MYIDTKFIELHHSSENTLYLSFKKMLIIYYEIYYIYASNQISYKQLAFKFYFFYHLQQKRVASATF